MLEIPVPETIANIVGQTWLLQIWIVEHSYVTKKQLNIEFKPVCKLQLAHSQILNPA